MDGKFPSRSPAQREKNSSLIAMLPVTAAEAIASVAALARLTWERHYIPLIGRPQTDYMLDRFQSVAAITGQIAGGYDYFLVQDEGRPVGYFAVVPDRKTKSALLSKIYVHPDRQGEGLGRCIVAFVEAYCRDREIRELWLTVNRQNTGSIAFYERVGFCKERTLVQDIGAGFVMDDYRMVMSIGSAGHGVAQRKERGDVQR